MTKIMQTNPIAPQLSPSLFDELSNKPTIIRGDAKSLMLLKRYLDLILHLGELEHTGDWDPYLKVTLTNDDTFETITGYPEIMLGDFNDDDQPNALNCLQEITSIGFFIEDDDTDQTEDNMDWATYFPLSDIKSIQPLR